MAYYPSCTPCLNSIGAGQLLKIYYTATVTPYEIGSPFYTGKTVAGIIYEKPSAYNGYYMTLVVSGPINVKVYGYKAATAAQSIVVGDYIRILTASSWKLGYWSAALSYSSTSTVSSRVTLIGVACEKVTSGSNSVIQVMLKGIKAP